MAERTLTLPLAGGDVTVRWDPEQAAEEGAVGVEPAPSADGPAESLRILSGRLEDGSSLLVAAARPPGADGHGDDVISASRVHADGSDESYGRALVSVEYDANGAPRRLTLELEGDEEEEILPHRGAADAREEPSAGSGRVEWSVEMELRLEGVSGDARFVVLSG